MNPLWMCLSWFFIFVLSFFHFCCSSLLVGIFLRLSFNRRPHLCSSATFIAISSVQNSTEFLLRCSIMRLTFTTHFIIKIIIGDRAYFALLSHSLYASLSLLYTSHLTPTTLWIYIEFYYGCRNDFALSINNFSIITLVGL